MSSPKVFLSAVTADFGLPMLDKLAKVIHDDFQCVCRYRANLGQGGDLLAGKLHDEIADANFVIHLVGPSFGHGPLDVESGERPSDSLWRPAVASWWKGPEAIPLRRSYTQMELDFALALKKPVFVFFVDDPQLAAAAANQSAENAALQAAHREAIRRRGHEYLKLESVAMLTELAAKLPLAVQQLKTMIAQRDVALDRAERAATREGRRNFRLILGVAAAFVIMGAPAEAISLIDEWVTAASK